MAFFRLLRRLLLVVFVLGASAAAAAWWYLSQPLPLPRAPYDFTVPSGSTLSGVARRLTTDGLLPHPAPLIALARWQGVDRGIKAGSYEVEPGITLPELLSRLTQGDVTQTSITIIEGQTFADLKAALRANRDVAKQVIELPDSELMARLGIEAPHPEGQFFPDTYFFATGSSDLAVLKRAQRLLKERLDASWEKRAPGLPFATPYEALILASIVEKETGRAVGSAADRFGVRQPAATEHAAADRSHGHLRTRRGVRRQPAQARPRGGHALQHVYARRSAADADRACIAGVDRRRAQSAGDSLPLLRFARRRQQRVLRVARRAQSRGGALPAQAERIVTIRVVEFATSEGS